MDYEGLLAVLRLVAMLLLMCCHKCLVPFPILLAFPNTEK